MLHEFLEALRLNTIFSFSFIRLRGKNSSGRAMFFFPLAGLLVGGLSLGFYILLYPFFSARAGHLILLGTPLLLTGARSLEGFARFCDYFLGQRSKPETLHLLKDGKLGLAGAAAIVILLMTKFELYQELPLKGWAFLMALTASKWAGVVLSFYLPLIGSEGGAGNPSRAGVREVVGASIILFASTVLLSWTGLYVFMALLGVLALLGSWYKKRLGGVTESLLRAAGEITELSVLIFAMAFYR